MGKLIEQISEELKKDPLFIGRSKPEEEAQVKKTKKEKEEEKARIEEALAPFLEAESAHEKFDVVFGYADDAGNLYATDDNGIRVILLAEELKKDLDWYRSWVKDKFIGTPFTVTVAKIDRKNGIVHVQSGRSIRSPERAKLLKEIDSELKKGMPVVPCRVASVQDDAAYMEICGSRILGICNVANWSKAYTRKLKSAVKTGDIIEFAIEKKLPKRDGADVAYALTRKPLTKDPWEMIPEDLFKKDAVLMVKCIDRPEQKSYWWGTSPLVPDIEIMGKYNDNFEGGVMTGVVYKCKIREIDLEKRRFRVSPFEPVSSTNLMNAIIFRKMGMAKVG